MIWSAGNRAKSTDIHANLENSFNSALFVMMRMRLSVGMLVATLMTDQPPKANTL
jgi:hypothetical protein